MNDLICALLLIVGGVFMALAGLGMARMPDLFIRLQAATKASTLGVGCVLLAVALQSPDVGTATRALLVIVLICLTAPAGAHVIARAAYLVGVPLWKGTLVDELGEYRRRESPPDANGRDEP